MKKTICLIAMTFLLIVPVGAEDFQEITVAPGETLWGIANKYLKDPQKWPEIVAANGFETSDPTIALPGRKLKVPLLLIKEEYRKTLLVGTVSEVRYKRKGEAEWKGAQKDMLLNYEDSLRTMEGAQARIQFPSKEVVQINENSYVVLKPERILQEIQLLRGDVRASRARVIMPQGTVVQPKGGKSDYQARVREDSTEVIFVYKGKVDVTAKGKTVTVLEGFGTEVPKAEEPKAPVPLSTFPDFNPAEMTANAPMVPIDVSKGVVSVTPPTKKESTQESKSKTLISKNITSNYRLQLSSDDKFTKIITEKTLPTGTSVDLKKENIPDGTYFMRVSFVDAFGSVSAPSQPSVVIKDTKAPQIVNLVPQEGQKFYGEESFCDIIGTVDGATLIAVNDEVLFISPTGRFNKFVSLQEGENLFKIVARDASGNETLINRRVTYSKAK